MTNFLETEHHVEFKVAAKTARLIGRESISSAEGAIIELVKNSYDADAKKCSVYIITKYERIPPSIGAKEYQTLLKNESHKQIIEFCYDQDALGEHVLSENITDLQREALEDVFSSYNSIVIVDDGEGMTTQVIQEHWMTIGTNAKEVTAISEDGRVRSGAKGIGRFALDKLGKSCRMTTKRIEYDACNWTVNWEDFEKKETLNQVTASLLTGNYSLSQKFDELLSTFPNFYAEEKSGTLIRIGHLREFWPKSRISKLYENLKSLLPPIEESQFNISLHSNIYPDEFGELSYSDYNEYDWKLSAEVKNGKVELQFYPAEYDLSEFDKDFFEHGSYKEEPLFTQEEFFDGKYAKKIELTSLLPNSDNEELLNTLKYIGEFTFSAYFLKKSTTTDEKLKYFYKGFQQSLRNKWLNQNGGVKVYRDSMRVRPYGIGNHFDWLKLDERAASSPAAPNRKGQWRVRAHQLAGIAHISRIKNPQIKDQSNREGLIENKTLNVFKNLLVALIKELEYQRSYVAAILDSLHKIKNEEARIVEQSDDIIEKHTSPPSRDEDLFLEHEDSSNEVKIDVLVQRAKIQDEKIDTLTEENKLLRVLASSGAMIASFAHDFKKMSNNLSSRHTELTEVLQFHNLSLESTQDALNPFSMIEDMERQDNKLNAWLRLTLDTLKQDRRKSKNVYFKDYFSTLEAFWKPHLASRDAIIVTEATEKSYLKCFEIELDSIFNNLISNSYEAFKRLGFKGDKQIRITVHSTTELIDFLYEDTGPGLSTTIQTPHQIFEPLFTTKTDDNGNPIGTGLGMSLAKGSIDDLGGQMKVLSNIGERGFKLKISLPTKRTE